MKKSAKKRTVDAERIVQALEGIVRDYRAGRGDVLNRMAEWEDPHQDGGDVSLGTVLTLALFGRRAIKRRPLNSVFVVNRAEYEALGRIGAGSVENGAAVVAETAHAWIKADPARIAAWLIKALPRLSGYFDNYLSVADHGMMGAEAWEVPIVDGPWADALDVLVSRAVKDGAGKEFLAVDVIRAMALAWVEAPWAAGTKAAGSRRRRRVTLAAPAGRSAVETFMAVAEARITELDAVIDDGYDRLAMRGTAEEWRAIEALETEREETILRTEECFAMLEGQCDDEGAIDMDFSGPAPPWEEDQSYSGGFWYHSRGEH
jgi:hypothetical protein